MESTKKVTKAMRNEDIICLLEGREVLYGTTVEMAVAHLRHENELLAKKNSTEGKKPTKTQVENENLLVTVREFLSTVTEGVTPTQVMEGCGLKSPQKATTLLLALVKTGEVVNEKEGRKSLYRLAI